MASGEAGAAVTVDGPAVGGAWQEPGFLGTYHHQVDAKGRLAVPSEFRRLLPDDCVVAPWPDVSLMIWTPAAWNRQLELFRRTAETFDQERDLVGLLTAHADYCHVDAQGRILLNASLRGFAGIAEQAVVVGRTDGVEICSEQTWRARGGGIDADRLRRTYQMAWQRAAADRRDP